MPSSDPTEVVASHRPDLTPYEALYKTLHADPELSFCEEKTAATVVDHLAHHHPSGYKVTPHIGGTGVAAVLHNGDGPTILLRADMDALPVEEKTGLPYASTKRMRDRDGIEHAVMHACGHDMHVTALLGAAELLYKAKDKWAGTLVLIFQPAEEKGAGAQAMVDDGLYEKHGVPIPDVVLGAHVIPFAAGHIGTREEAMMSAADSIAVTLHGRGSHASAPQLSVDPVVMGAYAITRLQTLISREVPPNETAVLTVASMQSGNAENVIAASAELKLNMRTFDEGVRTHLLEGVKRIFKAESDASRAPQEPEYKVLSRFPLTYNDPAVVQKLLGPMRAHFKDKYIDKIGQLGGSEDYSILGTSVGKPCCFLLYGCVDPEELERRKNDGTMGEMPYNHSAWFAPVIQPTLKVAVDGYAIAALTLLHESS